MNAREAQLLHSLEESNEALARCINGSPLMDFEIVEFTSLVYNHWKQIVKHKKRYLEDARFKGNDKP